MVGLLHRMLLLLRVPPHGISPFIFWTCSVVCDLGVFSLLEKTTILLQFQAFPLRLAYSFCNSVYFCHIDVNFGFDLSDNPFRPPHFDDCFLMISGCVLMISTCFQVHFQMNWEFSGDMSQTILGAF